MNDNIFIPEHWANEALKLLHEAFENDDSFDRQSIDEVNLLNDSVNERMLNGKTVHVILNEDFSETRVIPNHRSCDRLKNLIADYLAPCVKSIVGQIRQAIVKRAEPGKRPVLLTSRLPLPPSHFGPVPSGVAAASVGYGGLTLRVVMQYDSKECGVRLSVDMLGSIGLYEPLVGVA